MKPILLLPVGILCAGLGAAAAWSVSGSVEPAAEGGDDVVVVSDDGTRTYTAAEAAARIEQLETVVRKRAARESRNEAREAALTAAEASETLDALAALGDGGFPMPEHPSGRPYTITEIIELALSSGDPELRQAAIRRLRRVNTPAARETLEALLTDPRTPPEMRLEAAAALSRPPHRDQVTETLVNLLGEESDPKVKGQLALGVARLSARNAWMSEIAGLLEKETDPEARKELLQAVARNPRDPAAWQTLTDLATAEGADLEERRAALAALVRARATPDLLAAAKPLFEEDDPALRRDALRILAGGRGLPADTLQSGLADDDPGVRTTALEAGLRHLRTLQRDKELPKEEVRKIIDRTVELAKGDPDAEVRRAAVLQARLLPKADRDALLGAARADTDDFVRLSAYAASPPAVARQARDQYVTGLSSDDARVRGFAFRQLQRLYDVQVAYNPNWNPAARERAANDILGQLSQKQ